MALCQEAYQQVNELPSHSKYSMRNRQKAKEIHNPLRFGDASETERIHNATLRDQMLETRGQYDHSLHASKFSAPHSPRQASNTAPRYREYQPTKWMGKPLALTSTGTMGSATQKLGDNKTMPHDFVDMQLAHHKAQYGDTQWAAYQGRIGSLARQRKPTKEVDQDRMFHTNVAAGKYQHLFSKVFFAFPSFACSYMIKADRRSLPQPCVVLCDRASLTDCLCRRGVCHGSGSQEVGDLAAEFRDESGVHDGPPEPVRDRWSLRACVSWVGGGGFAEYQLELW
jgi:hypothetical protein